MDKIDLGKQFKDQYTAGKRLKQVDVGPGTYLVIADQGAPGGAEYQRAIEQLYGLAYTAKWSLKIAGVMDFAVGKLECVWDIEDVQSTPQDQWRWRVMIRVPDALTEDMIHTARDELADKKGQDTSAVRRETFSEGLAVQLMHVGPYDRIGESYERLAQLAEDQGLTVRGPGHEIYISDPRRAAPENLKTIVRFPVDER